MSCTSSELNNEQNKTYTSFFCHILFLLLIYPLF